MSFCTLGAPLTPIAPTISPSTLMGNPPPHAATRGSVGMPAKSDGFALDKVEKLLRDAEQSCVRLIPRNLDGRDRGPIHPAKALRMPASSGIATFSATPISLALAIALSAIFRASSQEMLYFFTAFAIGYLPPFNTFCC
jgi:hypothetical protein